MESIGLGELRQNASEPVRRVEEGEEMAITVADPDDQDWNARVRSTETSRITGCEVRSRWGSNGVP